MDQHYLAHPSALNRFIRLWLMPGRVAPFDVRQKSALFLTAIREDLLTGVQKTFCVDGNAPPSRVRGPLQGTYIDPSELLGHCHKTRMGLLPLGQAEAGEQRELTPVLPHTHCVPPYTCYVSSQLQGTITA